MVDYFIPENYKLDLKISKAQRRFSGTVTMAGRPLRNEIKMNAKNLEIKSVTTDTDTHPDWQLADDIITIKNKATKVTIEFSGHFSETAMNGLYLCKYKINGQPHELFATQFESHYACEAFPCIDEPAAKATFDISIASNDPDDKIILSNMPGKLIDGTWHFQTTPKMSTYLVAFAGGNLIKKSGHTNRGTDINIYATAAQPASSLDHALSIATECVEFYEHYFGVNYSLPKLDNIALPDFSAGAMENWGLITYRETCLLAADNAAEESREYIATVIAHEIAHQWFGDLVTMQWWNDLWLNESFASLMEGISLDALHPEYKVWDDFETNDVAAALHRDALPGVQSVQQEVKSPDEIATLFDSAIVYAKGERLLKMLREFIGDDDFRAGLTNYFKQHQYSNTTADDLWQALSDSSNLDIKALMNPWLTRPGYPVIKASLDGKRLTLEQKQFSLNGHADPSEIWPIPLSAGSSLPNLLDTRKAVIEFLDDTSIQLNIGDNSHFITKYDDKLFNTLVDGFDDLSNIDKIKLLRESILLSQAGLQDISQTIELLNNISNETNQAVLSVTAGAIGSLKLLTKPDSAEEQKLKQLANRIFAPSFERLFNDDEQSLDLNDKKSLSTVLSLCVYGDNAQAINYCQKQYDIHKDNLNDINGDIRPVVLSSVVKHNTADAFNRLLNSYYNCNDADLKQDICAGLTATEQDDQIKQLLADVTNSGKIKPQDVFYFISWLAGNRYARTEAWRWIRDNWPWITKVYGSDMSYDTFVNIAGGSLRTQNELKQYNDFFGSLNIPALERVIKVGRNNIESRLAWIDRNQPVLAQKLGNL